MTNNLISRWKKLSDPTKASIAFIFSSFILKGVSFLTTPIFTRLMSTNEYGLIATFNSWISIVDIFATLGLPSAGVINVGLRDHKGNRPSYLSSMIGLCNVITLLCFVLLCILRSYIGLMPELSNRLVMIMFLHLIFNPGQIFWVTCERYEYKYKLATIVTVLSVIFSQALSIMAIPMFDGNRGETKIIFGEIGLLLFSIPITVKLIIKGKQYINLVEWRNTLVFAFPLLPHYLSIHLMTSADRIMITRFDNQGNAGIYSVVVTISSIALLFWNAVNASLMPYTFENIEKRENGVQVTTKTILFGYSIICLLTTLLAPEVLRILGTSEYQTGVNAVPPIIAVSFLTAVYTLYSNIEFYYKKSKRIAMASIIAAIVNLILNYILIPRFGFVSAAYTTLVSNALLVVLHKRSYNIISPKKVYDDSFFIIISIIVTISCISCTMLYQFQMIRYGVILCLIIIVFLFRKKLTSDMRKVLKKGAL